MALKIASDEELRELALELGATVDFGDGRVFNAASRQGYFDGEVQRETV